MTWKQAADQQALSKQGQVAGAGPQALVQGGWDMSGSAWTQSRLLWQGQGRCHREGAGTSFLTGHAGWVLSGLAANVRLPVSRDKQHAARKKMPTKQ